MTRALRYRFERMDDGLARETTSGNLWTLIRLRKPTLCEACRRGLGKGAEAFRPLSEFGETVRYERLCTACVEARTAGVSR
jgi:hypothetical protein